MSNIMITKPGEPLPKTEKRAIDKVVFVLDLNNILEKNEAAINITGISSLLDLGITRTKRGKFLEIQVLPSDNGASQFLEYQIVVQFETTFGNNKSAIFNLRVYK